MQEMSEICNLCGRLQYENKKHVRLRTGHDCPEMEYSFFNLGARYRWMVNAMPRPLYTCTHFTVGWFGTMTGLEGC